MILNECGIDISAILEEQVRLGRTFKQIVEEVRSLNGSLCLKYKFGISPSKLGASHRIRVNLSPVCKDFGLNPFLHLLTTILDNV